MVNKFEDKGWNLLWAVSAIIIYNWLTTLLFMGSYFIIDSNYTENHYFMFDALFCIPLILLFSVWLYKIYRQKCNANTSISGVQEKYTTLKTTIIVLGFSGIANIWFIIAESISESISLISDSLQSFEDTWSSVNSESYFWVLMSVVVLGPIVEELLFRGLVFHYLEKFKAGWFPIVFSGIFFGIWHQEPVQVVYTAIMGIALGIVYAKTRSMKVTIAMHILNNFLSTLPPAIDTPLTQDILFYASLMMIIPAVLILVDMSKNMPHQQASSVQAEI